MGIDLEQGFGGLKKYYFSVPPNVLGYFKNISSVAILKKSHQKLYKLPLFFF